MFYFTIGASRFIFMSFALVYLEGTLPTEYGLLTHLTFVYLATLSNMEGIVLFFMQASYILGSIPTEWGNWNAITQIYFFNK
jgi:hypothetical protein